MHKATAQTHQAQAQAAAHQTTQQQASGTRTESPQGERIAQLAGLAKQSPASQRLAQLTAIASQSPGATAQRALAQSISHSPRQAAQRALTTTAHASSPHATAQRAGADEEALQRKAHAAPQANRTGLPSQLKSGIESLSGVSLDNVRVHYNSPQPAQLNAHAYAQGTDIHVAPGQEKHLPHEAWHVVQQAQGRVKPTMQMKSGVPVNDDAGLEREADVMGQRVTTVTTPAKLLAGESRISNGTVQRKTTVKYETQSLSYEAKTLIDPKKKRGRKQYTISPATAEVGHKMTAILDPKDPKEGSDTSTLTGIYKSLGDRWRKRNGNRTPFVQAHLLNADLGGKAEGKNLFPLTSAANAEHSAAVEEHVKRELVALGSNKPARTNMDLSGDEEQGSTTVGEMDGESSTDYPYVRYTVVADWKGTGSFIENPVSTFACNAWVNEDGKERNFINNYMIESTKNQAEVKSAQNALKRKGWSEGGASGINRIRSITSWKSEDFKFNSIDQIFRTDEVSKKRLCSDERLVEDMPIFHVGKFDKNDDIDAKMPKKTQRFVSTQKLPYAGGKKHVVGKKMVAYLSPNSPVKGYGTPAIGGIYDALKEKYRGNGEGSTPFVQAHLLNADIGGYGMDENLYPLTRAANAEHSAAVEDKVKRKLLELNDGQRLIYTVEATWSGAGDFLENPDSIFSCSARIEGEADYFINNRIIRSTIGQARMPKIKDQLLEMEWGVKKRTRGGEDSLEEHEQDEEDAMDTKEEAVEEGGNEKPSKKLKLSADLRSSPSLPYGE